MKQIRNNVFETNSSSTHSITLSIKDVNGKIIPDVIECKPFWEIDFEYQGKIADNISLILAAVWKNEMKLPVAVSGYESRWNVDEFIETDDTPKDMLEAFQEIDTSNCNDIGDLYMKYLKLFVESEAYKDIKSNIKQVFPINNIEIFDFLENKLQDMYGDDIRLQIIGLNNVLKYIEYDSQYHTVNKEKFKFFLQYAADIMKFESIITEYWDS